MIGGLLLFVLALVVLVAAAPFVAAASSDLAVSFPADPVPIEPGGVATVTLSVANVGDSPLKVAMTASQVKLLDDGQTQFLPTADPEFEGSMVITPQNLALKAGEAKDVRVRITAPKDVRPDDYYLGVLATPEVSSGQIRTVNAVGALIVLSVPGDRSTSLTAEYVDLPTLSWSPTVDTVVRVTNTGKNSVRFTTETVVSGFSSPAPSRIREKPRQLPAGLSRSVTATWKSKMGIGKYDLRTVILYNKSSQTSAQVVLTRTVYVVAPYWLAVPIGIVVLVIVLLVRRSRRRARRRREAIYGPAATA